MMRYNAKAKKANEADAADSSDDESEPKELTQSGGRSRLLRMQYIHLRSRVIRFCRLFRKVRCGAIPSSSQEV